MAGCLYRRTGSLGCRRRCSNHRPTSPFFLAPAFARVARQPRRSMAKRRRRDGEQRRSALLRCGLRRRSFNLFTRHAGPLTSCQGNGPNLTQPKPLYYALHLVFYYRVFFHSSTVQIDYVRSRRFFLPSLGHLIFYAPIRTNNLSQHRQTEVKTSPTFLLTCRLSKCISSCFIGLYCAQQ